ncbi:MAG TPA: AAA family ATPase [Azoarcus taiwanensis]|uniref:AAA domain-containing protein n=1 Tax=Azoarcus taiwanensis TaxID=666964 RepID=A0A972J8E2_9RHOO|nr:AAA family ATPase [Azoarcus taiwanensis]NMG03429.1 AAA domain-containing protein [Azoarcus taiwanensis]HRQ56960.1 AAA family ATPase [Azoarcus taiwanensis]
MVEQLSSSDSRTTWAGRERLAGLLDALESGLVERRRELRMALLAALAAEHTLLIGPPGTAKSELARRLQRAFGDVRYFERLLTRFTVPEELFGPLSISALEQDRYERHVAGFLPDASIAFIDEVFKANSAILNALLTLLNEREFDNGAGRIACPLISVIGATNTVPEDEVGEAFLDRFLMLVPVVPVSEDGFLALLAMPTGVNLDVRVAPLDKAERAALAEAAENVALEPLVGFLLAELRAWMVAQACYVSDRRWVKIVHVLRTAAASEGRSVVSRWDLGLLPCCVSADAQVQHAVSDWLLDRLGVGVRCLPERLPRVVEAFEAQLLAEREANDLDYDESGRLRFSPEALAGEVGDAKGGAGALRMTAARKRRYGQTHIDARVGQIDEALSRMCDYDAELATQVRDFEAFEAASLWIEPGFLRLVRSGLDASGARLRDLRARLLAARAGFEALPRLLPDPGTAPDPVPHPVLTTD